MTEASIRTVLRMRAQPGREDEFEAAWRAAAADISRVPGNVRQELARDLQDPRTFVITSDWTDRAAVDAFGRSAARETLTAALRDLRDDASRNTYQLLATVPAVPAPPVRIDLSTTVRPGEEAAFERAYQIVSARLNGTPGLIREELLKEPDSTEYHIFAEWETEQDFLNWVEDPSHADQSGPLVRWLSVDFNRRLFEIRYRPPQHVPTPGTVEFTPVATPASSSPARPVWASPATERSAPTPVPAVSMPIPPTPTPVPAVSTRSPIPQHSLRSRHPSPHRRRSSHRAPSRRTASGICRATRPCRARPSKSSSICRSRRRQPRKRSPSRRREACPLPHRHSRRVPGPAPSRSGTTTC